MSEAGEEAGETVSDSNKREDIENTVEDAFGLNFRSLRTLSDLFVRPNAVFRAYAARDRNTYTPALRLWFGIIGLQVLVSTLWGGWAGILRRQIETGDPRIQATYEQVSGGRLDQFIESYGDAMGVLQPILVALFTGLSVFVLGWFRRGLAWPARLNIAMGVLAAGSLVGLLMMPVLMLPALGAASWAPPIIVAIAYFVTFLRGAPGVLADTALGAWIKALIYAGVLMLLVVIAGIIIVIGAAGYAVLSLGSLPPG